MRDFDKNRKLPRFAARQGGFCGLSGHLLLAIARNLASVLEHDYWQLTHIVVNEHSNGTVSSGSQMGESTVENTESIFCDRQHHQSHIVEQVLLR